MVYIQSDLGTVLDGFTKNWVPTHSMEFFFCKPQAVLIGNRLFTNEIVLHLQRSTQTIIAASLNQKAKEKLRNLVNVRGNYIKSVPLSLWDVLERQKAQRV